jgi:hypothetical protein
MISCIFGQSASFAERGGGNEADFFVCRQTTSKTMKATVGSMNPPTNPHHARRGVAGNQQLMMAKKQLNALMSGGAEKSPFGNMGDMKDILKLLQGFQPPPSSAGGAGASPNFLSLFSHALK